MPATILIGPLQFESAWSTAGNTEVSTGTILITDTIPTGSPANVNASVIFHITTVVLTQPSQGPVTQNVNTTTTLPAIWSATARTVSATLTGEETTTVFFGSFPNNLQGTGNIILSGAGITPNTAQWTANLGEANVPMKNLGHRAGTITIAGSKVTFTITAVWQAAHAYEIGRTIIVNGFVQKVTTAGTSGGSSPVFPTVASATVTDGTVTWTCMGAGASSAVANLIPATGAVTSGAGFSLGPYTSMSGLFTSNTSGSGEFMPSASRKRQGDAWVTDMSSK